MNNKEEEIKIENGINKNNTQCKNDKSPKNRGNNESIDSFYLSDLYPDAVSLLTFTPEKLNAVISDCDIILDANVLLFPFELNSASLVEIEKVYKRLSSESRLLVPAHAIREFYKHRPEKITNIVERLNGAISRTNLNIIDKKISFLQENKKYLEALEKIRCSINEAKVAGEILREVVVDLKDNIYTDPVSILYRDTLSNAIIDLDINQEDRSLFVDKAIRRSKLKIAPGFKDGNKADGGLGDYIIWQTILQHGKNKKRNCIFVTEETKSDWWTKSNGAFMPKPELLEEYRRASNGKSFHMVSLSKLLSLFQADTEIISDVKDVEDRKNKYDAGCIIISDEYEKRFRNKTFDELFDISIEYVENIESLTELLNSNKNIGHHDHLKNVIIERRKNYENLINILKWLKITASTENDTAMIDCVEEVINEFS